MKEGTLMKKTQEHPDWPVLTRFNDWFEDFDKMWARPFGLTRPWRFFGREEGFMPTLDVYEKKGKLMVNAELPGVEKGNVHVELDSGNLVIRGEKKHEEKEEEEGYYRCESRYGSFYRSLPLSFDADPEKIQAKFKNGVLHLELDIPADQRSEAKEIAIH